MSVLKVFGLTCVVIAAAIILISGVLTIKDGPAMDAARQADEAKVAQASQVSSEIREQHDKAIAECMGGGDTLSLPPKVFREMYDRCEQALPSQALPSQALPSQALPSQALPSQPIPTAADEPPPAAASAEGAPPEDNTQAAP